MSGSKLLATIFWNLTAADIAHDKSLLAFNRSAILTNSIWGTVSAASPINVNCISVSEKVSSIDYRSAALKSSKSEMFPEDDNVVMLNDKPGCIS